jgi:hypothetical protein
MGAKPEQPPSANWLALQKVGESLSFRKQGQIFKSSQDINPDPSHRRKKRKLAHETLSKQNLKRGECSTFSVASETTRMTPQSTLPAPSLPTGIKNGESIDTLRRMILGELDGKYTDHQKEYVSGRRNSRSPFRLIFTTKAREIHRR